MKTCRGTFLAIEDCKHCLEIKSCFSTKVWKKNSCHVPEKGFFLDNGEPRGYSYLPEKCRTCFSDSPSAFNLCQAISKILLDKPHCPNLGAPPGNAACLVCDRETFMLCQGLELTLSALGKESYTFFQKELIGQIKEMELNIDGESCFGSFAFSPECQVCDFKILCMRKTGITGDNLCASIETIDCQACLISDCARYLGSKTLKPKEIILKKKIFNSVISLIEARKEIMITEKEKKDDRKKDKK